jgi:membrane protease YdiL (CAAX protease family)
MHEVEYIGGTPRRQEGTLGPAKLWVALGLLAVVMVVFMQWFRGELFGATLQEPPASVASSEVVDGGQYSNFAMNAKAAVKIRRAVQDEEDKKEVARTFKEELVPLAVTRAERLRLAVVGGELVGKDEALSRIAAVQKELDVGSPLASDAAWLKILYEKGSDKLSNEVQASLLDRHGWFGELALAFGRPLGDPYRRSAVGGREKILSTFKSLHWMQVGLFVVGIGVLALLVMNNEALYAAGQFVDPVPDENLHAFVLFCMGFVVLVGISLLPFGFGAEGSVGATVASELAIWSLLVIPAWPLVRGVKWSEFTRTVGLHGGGGVPVEVAIGIGAFLAWTPVTIGMSEGLAMLIRFFGSAGVEGSPSGHPMFEAPPSDSSLLVFLSVIASVVWAPVIEEIVFRGFLYGWLRERLGFVLSAAVSSIAFGIVHPYSPLGMIQVAAAGVMFAVLREWRGSLIAPMVAHALHNGMIAAISLAISKAIGG